MKTKILIVCLAFASLLANAQIKVWPGGKVYVGGTTTTPNSLLSVGAAGNSLYQGYFYNASTAAYATGLRAEIATPTVATSKAYTTAGVITCGTGHAFGIYGQSYQSTAGSSGRSFGIMGYAGNATTGYNYGVYGYLAGTNYGAGVLGTTVLGDPNVPAKYAGYFDGQIRTTNSSPEKPSGTTWIAYSDKGLKKDITPFKDGLDVIRKINPVNYKMNGIGGTDANKPCIGVIAQDVQPFAPYCIGKSKLSVKPAEASAFTTIQTLTNDSGSVSIVEVLNYCQDGLFYAMLNSIKQLDSTVTDLQKQLAAASGNRIIGSNAEDSIHVDLSNKRIVLDQNKPNPFRDNTNITYEINTDFTSAMIIFTDMSGDVIKEVPITKKGKGQLNVYGSDLTSGIYTYNIVVDGISIDTKKMIKNK